MRLLFTTVALSCLAAGQANATPFHSANVEVRNSAATLTVIPEDRGDVDVSVAGGERLPAPTARLEGDHVLIDGGVRVEGCGGWFQVGPRSSIRVAGYGSVAPDHLQRITVRVPRTLNLSVSGGVHSTIGASQGGRVSLSGCGHTDMSDAAGALDIALNGSGDVRVGAVSGALHAALNGSGDVHVAGAGAASSLALNGSGDVGVGDVAGGLDVRLVGSGDVRAGTTTGARLMLDGSGDIDVADVRGPLTARLGGSGGIRVRSAQSPSADLALSSSGDIAVRAGHADQLTVSNSGSGDVRFNGTAAASRLTLSGSGDVSVAQAGQIEVLRDSGSGGIHVGK